MFRPSSCAPIALVLLAACMPAQRDATGDAAPVATAAQVDPAAEAFARYDARLGLANARVGYDDAGCALYTATGPNGQPYMEAMLTPDGQSICTG